MQVSKQVIQSIKEQLDIALIISEYVPTLKRSGKNWVGLCPFHNDKNPSFSVAVDYGIYKCFSCGESGDLIAFIQKIEGLTFTEAVHSLAKRAGIELELSGDSEQYKKREDFVSFNDRLAGLFQYFLLNKPEGEKALSYLSNRGITREFIDVFKIGYVPRGYGRLERFLLKKGFKKKFLAESGIFKEYNGQLKALFFDRIIFPIYNHRNECVGFGGRVLSSDGKPKYLNSPETVVYKKSFNLYGIHTAKEAIKKAGKVYLVEGYIDVIACYKNGVANVVAPCGTAVTKDQLKLLSRYTQTIILLLDGDAAGAKGALKALQEAVNIQNITLQVLELPEGMDPDDYFAAHDHAHFMEYEKNARKGFDFLLRYYTKDKDLKDYAELMSSLTSIFDYIKLWESDIVKKSLLSRTSEVLSIEEGTLIKEFKTFSERGFVRQKEPARKQIENTEQITENIKENPNVHTKEELELLVLLFKYADSADLAKKCGLMEKYFSDKAMGELYSRGFASGFKENNILTDYIDSVHNHNVKEHFNTFIFSLENTGSDERQLKINIIDRIKRVRELHYIRKNSEPQEKIRLGQMYKDLELIKELQEEKNLNIIEIRKLDRLGALKD